MSLINALVDFIEDLNDRFSLRTEFMKMGFQDTLSAVRLIEESELLQWEREHWEEEMNADYQDMLGFTSRKAILEV
jgi:hypothetical protein